MAKQTTLSDVLALLFCILCLASLILIQYLIIQSDRGQAMAIRNSILLIPLAIIIIPAWFLIDRKLTHHFSRVFGILTQSLFLIYFIKKVIFYNRVAHDKQFYEEHFYDHYPPDNIELVFAFMIILFVLIFSWKRVKTKVV